MKKWLVFVILLAGCAKPPRIGVTAQVMKTSATTGRLKLTIQNEEDRPTTPILLVASVKPDNGIAIRVAHPAAFVLNRKEAREIIAPFASDAPSLDPIVVLTEGESGKALRPFTFKILPPTSPPSVPATVAPATPPQPRR